MGALQKGEERGLYSLFVGFLFLYWGGGAMFLYISPVSLFLPAGHVRGNHSGKSDYASWIVDMVVRGVDSFHSPFFFPPNPIPQIHTHASVY